jgi:repressor LexA
MREGVTPKQQAYLDFIGQYVALHREALAEADMVEFFRVSPPSVHRMAVTLADKGLISRTPSQARSIRLVESDCAVEYAPASRPFDVFAGRFSLAPAASLYGAEVW